MDKKIFKCGIPIDKYHFDDFCDALFKSIRSWELMFNITTKEIRFEKDNVMLFYFNN